MFFIAGMSDKLTPCGTLPGFRCPGCGQVVEATIHKGYSYVHAFFIPIYKYNIHYLVTCPHCAATVELNPEKGREFERTGQTHITPQDLADMTEAFDERVPRYCTQCGHTLSPGGRFCPGCGRPLAPVHTENQQDTEN